MKYLLNGKLIALPENAQYQEGDIAIEILTKKEYEETYGQENHRWVLLKSIEQAQYCKADLLKECVVGTFVIPNKEDLMGETTTIGYFMKKDRVVFVDDTGVVLKILTHLVEIQILEKTFVAHFLFEFMEYLIKDDVIFLQKYEEKLTFMEEELLEGNTEEFSKKILYIRKEILRLQAYYEQLTEVSKTLEENSNYMFGKEDCRLFGLFADRVDRLYDNTQFLKEYSLQMREMYQSQIDIKQNNVMQFLTVITAIFMPLTLIVGWYGMNFINMPELRSPYGYGIIIAISIIVVGLEIWYFKIKKWLK
ncbi:MAG: CorA family divalent cation transporter [Lachnospiraceae bacterium]